MKVLQNRLVEKTTNWPIWYAIIPMIAVTAPSFILTGISSLLPNNTILTKINPILQFALLTLLAVGLVWIFQKRKLSRSDLGLDKKIDKQGFIIIIAVFVISYLLFQLINKFASLPTDPIAEFKNTGLGSGFISDLALIVSGVLLAPICEEIIYRGIMLRSLHDGFFRWVGKKNSRLFSIPVILAITLTALAFILPHVADMKFSALFLAYFITSAGFSLVFILTRSLSAAMVSHSLQSCFTYSVILLESYKLYPLSPIIYIISLSAPIIVYFTAKWISVKN